MTLLELQEDTQGQVEVYGGDSRAICPSLWHQGSPEELLQRDLGQEALQHQLPPASTKLGE